MRWGGVRAAGAPVRAQRCVADQVCHGAAEVLRHLLDDFVAFGVNSALVEGIFGVANAEKSGGLLESFVPEAGDLPELTT